MKKISYTKKDISRFAAHKLNISINETKILCDCFFEVISDMFIKNQDHVHIEIRNFGVFDIKKTKQRTNALNPKTKEKVIIPERKKVYFKPSKKLKTILYNQ